MVEIRDKNTWGVYTIDEDQGVVVEWYASSLPFGTSVQAKPYFNGERTVHMTRAFGRSGGTAWVRS
jgi:hypothetical protein